MKTLRAFQYTSEQLFDMGPSQKRVTYLFILLETEARHASWLTCEH